MAFKFSLDFLLRLFRTVEEREERALQVSMQRVAAARQALAEFEELQRSRHAAIRVGLSDGYRGSELHLFDTVELNADQQRTQLETAVKDLEHAADLQRDVWRGVRRRRELMEAMRTRQLDAHNREALRHEQRDADDAFLLAHRPSPAEPPR